MKESQVHQAFSHWLDSEGIPYLHSRTDKRTTSAKGDPDYLVALAGKCIFLEIKVGINKLSPAQEKRITYLRKAGNTVKVVWCLQDAVNAVQEWAGVVTLPSNKNALARAVALLKDASKADHDSTQKGSQADPVINLPVLVEPIPDAGEAQETTKKHALRAETSKGLGQPEMGGHFCGGQSLSEQEKANSVQLRGGEHAAGVSSDELFISNFMGIPTVFQRDKDGYHKLLRTATQYDLLHIGNV